MKIISDNIPEGFKEVLTNGQKYTVQDKVHGCNMVYVVDDEGNRRVINLDRNYYGDWRVV